MVGNQDAISLDANTFMLKAAYSFGDFGTVIAQGSITEAGLSNLKTRKDVASDREGNDFTDLELLYVVKAGGVDYLAGYVHQMYDTATGATTEADATDIVRVWARYNF